MGNCVMQEEVTCRSSWSTAELENKFWTLKFHTLRSPAANLHNFHKLCVSKTQ